MFKAGVLLLALGSSLVLAKAQTPDDLTQKGIEDLMNVEVDSVYSASEYSQKATETPSSVSIVTAEQIQRHGYRTLAEIRVYNLFNQKYADPGSDAHLQNSIEQDGRNLP